MSIFVSEPDLHVKRAWNGALGQREQVSSPAAGKHPSLISSLVVAEKYRIIIYYKDMIYYLI
jgi:hypothetical protein